MFCSLQHIVRRALDPFLSKLLTIIALFMLNVNCKARAGTILCELLTIIIMFMLNVT